MKGEGKTKPATDAEVTTVDPESGFEGERRGALRLVWSIHVVQGEEMQGSHDMDLVDLL